MLGQGPARGRGPVGGGVESRQAGGSSAHGGRRTVLSGRGAWSRVGGGKNFQNLSSVLCMRR
jgi:hypothetical protein